NNAAYVVTVTPATGFGGNISITPSVTATPSGSVTGSIGTAQTVAVSSSNDVAFTVSFTATLASYTSALSIGSNVSWVGQTFSVPLTSTPVSVGPAYTMAWSGGTSVN